MNTHLLEVENFYLPEAFQYSRLEGDSENRCGISDKGKLNHGGEAGRGGRGEERADGS